MLSVASLALARCQLPDDETEIRTIEPDLKLELASSDERIIVIGAGIAGLAAARTLKDAGYRVLVLEARDRIGGRIWTDESLGAPLDMGASWIHGPRGNPITKIARDNDIETVKTDYDSITVYNAEGYELSDLEYEQLDAWIEELVDALEEERIRRNTAGEPDISLGEAIEILTGRGELSVLDEDQHDFAVNVTLELEYAAAVEQLSLKDWGSDDAFPGTDVIFPKGYVQIAAVLADGLDIQTGQDVTSVEYGAHGILVTSNGSEHSAARVVCTLPLGVLQQETVQFSPALPAEKQAALEGLGMHVLNKVYLRFPEPFWAEDDSEFICHISTEKGVWPNFMNLHEILGEPILLAFNAGDFGQEIESWSDDKIVNGAMEVLRTIYDEDIPDPDGWLITRWGSDPHAGGSYSHTPPGSGGADRELLAAPLADRLFFAGEATSAAYPATVHGAYLSGVRAAQEIIDNA